MALVLGLFTAVAWGSSDYFGAKAARSANPAHSAGMVIVLSAVICGLTFLTSLPYHFHLDTLGALFAASAGSLIALGYIAFYRGLSRGPVSVVSAIGGAHPLITALVAIGFFSAHPTFSQMIGVGLIVVGLVASSGIGNGSSAGSGSTPGLRWAVATIVFWGVDSALLNQAVARLGWEPTTLIQLVSAVLTLAVLIPFAKARPTRKELGTLLRSSDQWAASVLYALGAIAFNVGLGEAAGDGGTVITALAATYPALTILLAVRHFQEKLRPLLLGGAAMTILGTVTLSWH